MTNKTKAIRELPTSDTDTINANVQQREQVDVLNDLSAMNTEKGAAALEEVQVIHQPLSAELLDERVGTLIAAAGHLFFEPVQRHVGTNGKAYPVDFDFDARALKDKDGTPIEGTGEIVVVDKYDFLNRGLARLQCSGLDMMLRNQKEQVERQRNSIQREIRFARNAGVDQTDKINRMADFLEHLIEQCSIVETALNAAVENYALAFGDDYIPKDQAAKVVEVRKAALGNETNARLAKLGIK